LGLPPLIRSLLDPASYAAESGPVELLQTHISYILLTSRFAYKIKKPVNFGFLDFTTLEKRRFFCEEEVRLNRRLAPEVYLGVVPVSKIGARVQMEGRGEAVEYAVKMTRLPDEEMLINALERSSVLSSTIKAVGERIAAFHASAATDARISSFGAPALIRKNTGENFSQTEAFVGRSLSRGLFDRVRDYTDAFLRKNEELFLRRMAQGFIRDCHGDIHCEHVLISNGIEVIDCIEFNERFRLSDTVADAAFLSMDLDFHNRADLARDFDSSYFAASGDAEGRKLLDFYKCYRAFVRGKVDSFKSTEPEVSTIERSSSLLSARRHFHLAGLYSSGGVRPTLVVVRGLSGTGKSTVAALLAEEASFVRLSSDAVRKELAGIAPSEHRHEGWARGIYSEEFTEKTYSELIRRAGEAIKEGRSVVLDATFSKKRFIEAARLASARAGAEFHLIECSASDATVKKHFIDRCLKEGTLTETVSDADWDIYLKQKSAFEPVDEPLLPLSSEVPVETGRELVYEKIFG